MLHDFGKWFFLKTWICNSLHSLHEGDGIIYKSCGDRILGVCKSQWLTLEMTMNIQFKFSNIWVKHCQPKEWGFFILIFQCLEVTLQFLLNCWRKFGFLVMPKVLEKINILWYIKYYNFIGNPLKSLEPIFPPFFSIWKKSSFLKNADTSLSFLWSEAFNSDVMT